MTVTLGGLPSAPTTVAAIATNVKKNGATVTVTWADTANNETGFTIKRATDLAFTQNLTTATAGANATSFSQSAARGATLYYCVQATNANGASACTTALPFPLRVP